MIVKDVIELPMEPEYEWVTGPVRPGLTGLCNLGNTCYMNSVLQCLSHLTYPYFMDDYFVQDIDKKSETQGFVATQFAHVVRELWSGSFRYIAPRYFKNTLGFYNNMFHRGDQQDAHEFLLILMELLQQDLKYFIRDNFYGQPRSVVMNQKCAQL